MSEWFKQTPMQPTRGKCSWEELPSDLFANMLEWDTPFIGDSNQTDRDKLANNR